MPKGSSNVRLEAIKKLGAKAEIKEINYDNTVEYAKKKLNKKALFLYKIRLGKTILKHLKELCKATLL